MRHALIGLMIAAASLAGQTAGIDPEFEATSIRLSGPRSVRGSDGGPGQRDPIRYVFGRASLLDLIVVAYDLQPFRITSARSLRGDEFDFSARIPQAATEEQFRLMMRKFLAERFHLKSHIETREFPVYALIPAKGGMKGGSTPKPGDERFPQVSPEQPTIAAKMSLSGNGLVVVREPISQVTRYLPTDRPMVIDETGLTGIYTFTLWYSQRTSPDTEMAPDLATALHDQVGLDLVAKKVPLDALIVDSFDRLPTEN